MRERLFHNDELLDWVISVRFVHSIDDPAKIITKFDLINSCELSTKESNKP
ncbi:hypothetical protein ENUP19_0037G0033 [Entamoeba nuttalli]|uniref:Uncharacterized protein n=1 Tax=Entamoeba nuttalli TaxID=412467 RepID=A0ABQ0D9K9_9EUKA